MTVLAVDDEPAAPIRVHVEQRVERPVCAECATPAWIKERPSVELVDLPCFGRPARLVWRKHRWCCPAPACPTGSWTGQDRAIAAPRLAMTDRAGRWVDRAGRPAAAAPSTRSPVELGCDWHTVNDAVIAYGHRAGRGPRPHRRRRPRSGWTRPCSRGSARGAPSAGRPRSSTSAPGGSSMSSPGRSASAPCAWLAARAHRLARPHRGGRCWICRARTARCSTRCCPHAIQVADPFHLVKLANTKLDECRRRVQNETLGHRGRKDDPLYRCPAPAHQGRRTPRRPRPHQAARAARGRRPSTARSAPPGTPRKSSASIYDHHDPDLAAEFVTRLGRRPPRPSRARPRSAQLGRTILRWRDQIVGLAPRPRLQRTDRSRQQPDQAHQAGRVRVHPLRATTGSASCSTPASPTGTYSPPSHPAEIRRADKARR